MNQILKDAIKKVIPASVLDLRRRALLKRELRSRDFEPNIDQSTGSFSRIVRGMLSGVVLTAYPFNLKIKSERVICETPEQEGALKVIVYEL